ncbi:MAG: 7-cyano-7-deazaguanine synthase QueC [Nitrospinae bacterium]|nr:7-cyano-7-deazaguanine synthase QueC [Nitrospinota bacterium]
MNKKAIILSSGGIDSTTTMAIAKSEGFDIYSMSFNYGQRHSVELKKGGEIAKFFKAKGHIIIDIDLRNIGGSALTDNIEVPKDRKEEDILRGIPITYVPARNTIFLSFALAWAEIIGAYDIFIGVNAVDYSGYPDCRLEYIRAYEKMAELGTKMGVEEKRRIKIHTPLISLTKKEIIRKGLELGVDFSMTHSCYDPTDDGKACGRCDSCYMRLKGFREAGVKDPLVYASN